MSSFVYLCHVLHSPHAHSIGFHSSGTHAMTPVFFKLLPFALRNPPLFYRASATLSVTVCSLFTSSLVDALLVPYRSLHVSLGYSYEHTLYPLLHLAHQRRHEHDLAYGPTTRCR
jgi:hypothetical protein